MASSAPRERGVVTKVELKAITAMVFASVGHDLADGKRCRTEKTLQEFADLLQSGSENDLREYLGLEPIE